MWQFPNLCIDPSSDNLYLLVLEKDRIHDGGLDAFTTNDDDSGIVGWQLVVKVGVLQDYQIILV